MNKIGARAISAVILTAVLGLVFWLRPNLEPSMFATTPDGAMFLFAGVFVLFWAYLVVQGYPVSHGYIGSSTTHNLDNIVSGVPAVAALFGLFIHLFGFWPMSAFNLILAGMTLAVVIYDLWVIGGAAAKINRLTDEIKAER
jgi:hypothetical protein